MPKTQRACYELGQQLKEEGNNFFKQGNYAEAVKKYAKVRAFLRSMMPTEGGADNSQFLNMIGAAGPEEGLAAPEEEAFANGDTNDYIAYGLLALLFRMYFSKPF